MVLVLLLRTAISSRTGLNGCLMVLDYGTGHVVRPYVLGPLYEAYLGCFVNCSSGAPRITHRLQHHNKSTLSPNRPIRSQLQTKPTSARPDSCS